MTVFDWRRSLGTRIFPLAWALVVWGLAGSLGAAPAMAQKQLIVGTKVAPPFAIKNADGSWSGLSIDLWRQIAAQQELDFTFEERDLAGLLKGIEDRSLDAAVAALTITAEREQRMDFSHPFHTSGLGIAVRSDDKGGWLAVAERFFSLRFVQVIASLALVLLVFGFLVWLFERRKNPEQFGGGPLKGIGAGFWWSAVTMTTVGYGDKAPATLGGRLVGMVWMFAAIIIISSFTAAITSSLTLTGLESRVRGPQDLHRVRVATVADSTSAAFLQRERIGFRSLASPAAAMEALARGEVDAVVYDAPILRYLVNTLPEAAIAVVPQTFERQDYGIALPTGSDLREPVNRLLLEKINSPWWSDALYRYLGGER